MRIERHDVAGDIRTLVEGKARAAREAARALALCGSRTKNDALLQMARGLEEKTAAILDANRADLDNRIATYLNIDANSGFAPQEWQSHVGNVVVARKDRKPLLPHHLEGVWMYCDRILELFGEGDGAPTRLYNRQAFEKWWKLYCKEQKGFRSGAGGEENPDSWQAVRSPYEV